MPPAVRIIAVADTFDAMTSERPYRKPMSMLEAVRELVRLAPEKFDPIVVQGLLNQLRSDAQGVCTAPVVFHRKDQSLPLSELERLSMELSGKTSGQRVYFA